MLTPQAREAAAQGAAQEQLAAAQRLEEDVQVSPLQFVTNLSLCRRSRNS